MKEPTISSDPAILGGKPIIAGTRIAVSTILDLLAVGLSIDDVLKEYPGLTKKDVQGAISFASARQIFFLRSNNYSSPLPASNSSNSSGHTGFSSRKKAWWYCRNSPIALDFFFFF